jgi:hypothetical protein
VVGPKPRISRVKADHNQPTWLGNRASPGGKCPNLVQDVSEKEKIRWLASSNNAHKVEKSRRKVCEWFAASPRHQNVLPPKYYKEITYLRVIIFNRTSKTGPQDQLQFHVFTIPNSNPLVASHFQKIFFRREKKLVKALSCF